jgi:hypothetical protein
MISLKSFVEAIQGAIFNANVTLMDQHEGLLDKYFSQVDSETEPGKKNLVPKTVTIQYPHLDSSDAGGMVVKMTDVQVPLITLVPLTISEIKKATVSVEFEMDVVDGDLQLDFTSRSSGGLFRKKKKIKHGKIDIILTPRDSTEGVKILVEGYERMLKRQFA